jgi:transposase
MATQGHSIMEARPQNRSLNVGQRLQALTLAEEGIAAKIVQSITEVSIRSISDLKKKTRSRGYDSQISRVLKLEYVTDASRSGRSFKITSVIEAVIVENVQADRHEREKTSAFLKYEHEVSSDTILRVLKRNDFRSCKSTMKLGLDAAMMKARLQFCLRYKD